MHPRSRVRGMPLGSPSWHGPVLPDAVIRLYPPLLSPRIRIFGPVL